MPKSQLKAKLDLSGKNGGPTYIKDADGLGERSTFLRGGGVGRRIGFYVGLSQMYLSLADGSRWQDSGFKYCFQHSSAPEDS